MKSNTNRLLLIVVSILILLFAFKILFLKNRAQAPSMENLEVTNNTDKENSALLETELQDSEEKTKQNTPENTTLSQDQTKLEQAKNNNIIIFTDNGFSPSLKEIKIGETVRFLNNSNEDFWPASAMHPNHSVYPSSGIHKCYTEEAINIFDACKGIPPDTFWEFTFDQQGEWSYHDHLNAVKFGKIKVIK